MYTQSTQGLNGAQAVPQRIDDLDFDQYNESEMAAHGVTVREVLQVLDRGFRIKRNKAASSTPYLMVGRTYGGRWLTIPIAPTNLPGVWRPATAFPSRPNDKV